MKSNKLKFISLAIILLGIVGVWFLVETLQSNVSTEGQVFSLEIPSIYSEPLQIISFDSIFSIRPLEVNAVSISKEEEKIFYREAYANTDVLQEIFAYKIKEDIILKAPGHPSEFRFELNLSDYDYEITEKGDIEFYHHRRDVALQRLYGGDDDKVLRKIYTIPAPFMIDAVGEESGFEAVKTIIKDNVLIIKPSSDWLETHQYPIVLDPTIELSVLNLFSHPLEGDDWTVEFTTIGEADLKIIPNDQATIDDDDFVSLWCGSEQVFPQILTGDVIFVSNWQCADTAKVIHNTLKAGDHVLRIEFGSEISYAYNHFSTNHLYSWSENAGWINASSTHEMVSVTSDGLTGYAWGENIGWIKFDHDGTAGAINTTATNWGVTMANDGTLAGYAWGENIGWINFDSTHEQVSMDRDTGTFTGYAWSENIGWINFGHTESAYVPLDQGLPYSDTLATTKRISPRSIEAYGYAREHGLTITERGFKYGTTEADTFSESEFGSFSSGPYDLILSSLEKDTTYYVRSFAVNSAGTTYGEYEEITIPNSSAVIFNKNMPVIFKSGVIFK